VGLSFRRGSIVEQVLEERGVVGEELFVDDEGLLTWVATNDESDEGLRSSTQTCQYQEYQPRVQDEIRTRSQEERGPVQYLESPPL